MRRLLVDSSVWIQYLRDADAALCDRVEVALSPGGGDEVVMCGPVAMELRMGASERQLPAVTRIVEGLPLVALDESVDWSSAASLRRLASAQGAQVRALPDCVIAAVAIRTGSVVVHRDRDFELLAEVSPLQQERWG